MRTRQRGSGKKEKLNSFYWLKYFIANGLVNLKKDFCKNLPKKGWTDRNFFIL